MQSNTPESRTLTRANFAFGIEQTDNLQFRRAWQATAPIIAGQDEYVLNPQNPRYYGCDPRRDCSTRFDAAGMHYRQLHGQRWGDRRLGKECVSTCHFRWLTYHSKKKIITRSDE